LVQEDAESFLIGRTEPTDHRDDDAADFIDHLTSKPAPIALSDVASAWRDTPTRQRIVITP
jgi:hypothetical protein